MLGVIYKYKHIFYMNRFFHVIDFVHNFTEIHYWRIFCELVKNVYLISWILRYSLCYPAMHVPRMLTLLVHCSLAVEGVDQCLTVFS